MQYSRTGRDSSARLLASEGDRTYDLTAADPVFDSYRSLLAVARAADRSPDALARRHCDDETAVDSPAAGSLSAPIDPDEVWAAGVTYRISEEAREAESGMPEIYLDVYEADRPELFFKGTASHTVGPGESIGVRGDSDWNVPEPELGVVLFEGEIVGYTIGNDVSSRAIEGTNPLYLPQAKVYDRSCALGPRVVSADAVDDPHDLEMTMEISRDGESVYEGTTNTGEMVRTCRELRDWYTRHQAVPELGVLLTGTSLVPPEEFTLRSGDHVTISIEQLGELANGVVEV